MDRNLIFDIGFHKGEDTAFYLAKGFKVVAVEANPDLVEAGRERFSDAVRSGTLQIEHVALSEEAGEERSFYVSTFSDWSSLRKKLAERGANESREVTVTTTTLAALVEKHGLPYYIKSDIEGFDHVCAAQLPGLSEKPPYVSFEMSSPLIFDALREAGYSRFQFLNQRIHDQRHFKMVEREGRAVRYRFTASPDGLPVDCSGPFGLDLPDDRWVELDALIERYERYSALQKADAELGVGWLDLHARL